MVNKHTKKIITLGGVEFIVINLTKPLSLDTEVFPGDPKPKRIIFSEIEKDGYEHYLHLIGDHNFQPHGDAPKHFLDDSRGMEFFNLDYFFNNACLIDLSCNEKTVEIDRVKWLIEIDDLRAYETLISQKEALIIRTGYDIWLEKNKPHDIKKIPYLSKNAVDMLAKYKNLRVVGLDSISVDKPGNQSSHKKLKEKLIIESMVNLHDIPEKNRENFDLQTSPIVIAGATGGPICAYAFIRKNKL